jgi:protein-export membrane protein SecD
VKKIFKILFLPVISISLFALVYVQELSPKLGLDLQGGISVILTADEGTEQELIEQAVEIMRTRIEAFGDVQEPEIAISGENSVLVQLPGVTDQEKAIEALGTTGLLTFRPVLDSSLNTGYSPALDLIVNPDDPEDVTTVVKEGITGVDEVIGVSIADNPEFESYILSVNSGYPVIYRLGPAELTGNDIADAIAVFPENEWIVSLEFKDESASLFTDLTKKLANENGEQRKLAIVLDGEVVSAPGIAFDVDPTVGITGGTAAISMGNADGGEAANNLAIILRYGALPVSFERSSIEKVSGNFRRRHFKPWFTSRSYRSYNCITLLDSLLSVTRLSSDYWFNFLWFVVLFSDHSSRPISRFYFNSIWNCRDYCFDWTSSRLIYRYF